MLRRLDVRVMFLTMKSSEMDLSCNKSADDNVIRPLFLDKATLSLINCAKACCSDYYNAFRSCSRHDEEEYS
jgi:hypothetical protein